MHENSSFRRAAVAAVVFAVASGASLAQTQVKSGFNVFSVEQDVEIGRQSAVEAERQLPLLRDSSVESYVERVGRRLADATPGPKNDTIVELNTAWNAGGGDWG